LNRRSVFSALLIAAPISLFLALMLGETRIAPSEIFTALVGQDGGIATEIVRSLRLPRALNAFACGSLLALSGALLQVLLRNPLADPYVLGISGGAGVAVLASWLLGFTAGGSGVAAAIGALAALVLTVALSARSHGWGMERLLLTGVVLASGFGALLSLLLTLAPAARLPGMMFFLLGDLSVAEQAQLPWLVLAVLGVFAVWIAPRLDVLSLGEIRAAALGLAVRPVQAATYLAAAIAAATVVVQAGAIGFVGLMVPHALRMLGMTEHRLLLPGSLLLGGSFLAVADAISRSVIAPAELPVGVITALVGVPVMLWLLGRG
jgi:iron complex transport system permease protein